MDRAEELRNALASAERAFGHVVERYRLALSCCAVCGDFFKIGDVAIVMIDVQNRIAFEHETCPEETEDYGSSYRNDQQGAPSGPSPV